MFFIYVKPDPKNPPQIKDMPNSKPQTTPPLTNPPPSPSEDALPRDDQPQNPREPEAENPKTPQGLHPNSNKPDECGSYGCPGNQLKSPETYQNPLSSKKPSIEDPKNPHDSQELPPVSNRNLDEEPSFNGMFYLCN